MNLLFYIFKRIIAAIPVFIIVTIIAFLLIHLLPGDPALAMLGRDADPASLEALRREMGLYDPLPVQYINWITNVLKGDLGRSVITRQPVLEAINSRFPHTLSLAVSAIFVAILISLPAGILAAARQNSAVDRGVMFFALIGVSMPSFWAGILLIILFAVTLGWLPGVGWVSVWEDPAVGWRYLILPSLTLGFILAASAARMTRSSMLEVMRQDYMRTARAKGLSGTKAILGHGLKNAFIPVITIIGIEFGWLLGGTTVIETLFGIPGVGRLVVSSISNRDYPMIQGAVLYVAVVYMLVNLLVDVIVLYLNPRIRS